MSMTVRLTLIVLLLGRAAHGVCPDAANLVPNCGFESNSTGWSLLLGDDLQRSTNDPLTGVGALALDADPSGTVLARSTCVAVAPSTSYALGAYFLHSFGTLPATCKVQIRQNSDGPATCAAFVSVTDTPLRAISAVDWTLVDRTLTTAANAGSAFLDLSCIGGADDTVIFVDDAFLGVGLVAPLFRDGFESQNFSKWSTAVG